MCTVTYIPTSDGFILTSSRDENPEKETLSPAFYQFEDKTLAYPKDLSGKGTWIAVDHRGHTSCLLNGAMEKHIKKEKYRKSRGILVLESLLCRNFSDFYRSIDLEGIEPFTMVMVEPGTESVINPIILRWNGETKHLKAPNSKEPFILSSSTLYNLKAKKIRQNWFDNWINTKSISPQSILDFHNRKHGLDPEIDILMKLPNGIETVSISQIHYHNSKIDFKYLDLLRENSHTFTIISNPSSP
ncbi:NRDE family protein [Fontibacter flavus]|uniref:NRDE family protein n=1 Tax=Fontibacter flavus TaxID=654838 RepID=A0ABV6FWV6_9BACT